jgi:hypothetical protein
MKLVVLLLFFCIGIYSHSQAIKKEEYKAINEVFPNLLDSSMYYFRQHPPYLPETDSLIVIAKNPIKYTKELKYWDSAYYSFRFSKKLIDTKGEEEKVSEFEDQISDFCDSITSLKDDSKLVLFATDKLKNFDSRSYNELSWELKTYPKRWEDNKLDSSILFPVDTTLLKERQFNYALLTNTKPFLLNTKPYPSRAIRDQTKEKEIGIIYLTRIILKVFSFLPYI